MVLIIRVVRSRVWVGQHKAWSLQPRSLGFGGYGVLSD